jgi:hypothetical protein
VFQGKVVKKARTQNIHEVLDIPAVAPEQRNTGSS